MGMGAIKGKNIVVGVCGGIAAYKTASLVRLFVKAGADVQVIMTPSAKEFITPLTMSTLSRHAVITEFFTANTGEWHSHVDLGLWADAFVVAPATACTIGKWLPVSPIICLSHHICRPAARYSWLLQWILT